MYISTNTYSQKIWVWLKLNGNGESLQLTVPFLSLFRSHLSLQTTNIFSHFHAISFCLLISFHLGVCFFLFLSSFHFIVRYTYINIYIYLVQVCCFPFTEKSSQIYWLNSLNEYFLQII